MATPVDPDSQNALNMGTIAALKEIIATARDFVTRVYVPDLVAIAGFYKDWAGYGAGVGNYLSYGEYPEGDGGEPRLFLPRGLIHARDLAHVERMNPEKISEQVKHSWYTYAGGDDKGLHPFKGETNPEYTGPTPPYERLNTDEKYSWLKSPRYDGQPMEVGPLARMLVAYGSGHARVKELVDKVLKALGVGPAALFSTLGRTAARGIETQVLVEKMDDWVNALADNMARRDLRIQDNSQWDPASLAEGMLGRGLSRGAARRTRALGPYPRRRISGTISASCRAPGMPARATHRANRGPYEAALVGTPIAKPDQPLEILRTVHSFDPCMACGVHVVDVKRRELARVKAV